MGEAIEVTREMFAEAGVEVRYLGRHGSAAI
jgi:hypothetical protein